MKWGGRHKKFETTLIIGSRSRGFSSSAPGRTQITTCTDPLRNRLARADSEQLNKLFDRQSRSANQSAQSSNGQLPMLRDGKVRSLTLFCHHAVAANLTNQDPPGFAKGLHSLFAGDIGKLSHAPIVVQLRGNSTLWKTGRNEGNKVLTLQRQSLSGLQAMTSSPSGPQPTSTL